MVVALPDVPFKIGFDIRFADALTPLYDKRIVAVVALEGWAGTLLSATNDHCGIGRGGGPEPT